MGLDFNHPGADGTRTTCCPQWAYDRFSQFRSRLAEAEGFNLREMQGFGGHQGWDGVESDLKSLLNHSDCAGDLTPAECAQVFPRLRQIVEGWDLDDPAFDYDRRNGLVLATCMEACARNDTALEFC